MELRIIGAKPDIEADLLESDTMVTSNSVISIVAIGRGVNEKWFIFTGHIPPTLMIW